MSEADTHEFMLVLRQALLMIVRWIEKHYGLVSETETNKLFTGEMPKE